MNYEKKPDDSDWPIYKSQMRPLIGAVEAIDNLVLGKPSLLKDPVRSGKGYITVLYAAYQFQWGLITTFGGIGGLVTLVEKLSQ